MNEVFEEMNGELDEDQRSSDDNDCINDCSKNLTKISERIVDNSQISALNELTKQCAIYFYYSTGSAYAACVS